MYFVFDYTGLPPMLTIVASTTRNRGPAPRSAGSSCR